MQYTLHQCCCIICGCYDHAKFDILSHETNEQLHIETTHSISKELTLKLTHTLDLIGYDVCACNMLIVVVAACVFLWSTRCFCDVNIVTYYLLLCVLSRLQETLWSCYGWARCLHTCTWFQCTLGAQCFEECHGAAGFIYCACIYKWQVPSTVNYSVSVWANGGRTATYITVQCIMSSLPPGGGSTIG